MITLRADYKSGPTCNYFFCFFLHNMACGIFIPQSGIKPAFLALKVQTES